jgi:hypothetical protein
MRCRALLPTPRSLLPELTNPAVIKDKYPNSDEVEMRRDRVTS